MSSGRSGPGRDRPPVVAEAHAGRQQRLALGMRHGVRHVDQPRLGRAHALRHVRRLGEREVRRVRLRPEAVEHERLGAAQRGDGLVRHRLDVRQERERADADAHHVDPPVATRDGRHLDRRARAVAAADHERRAAVGLVEVEQRRAGVGSVEDVTEHLAQHRGARGQRPHRDGRPVGVEERPEVVQPHDVVEVVMRHHERVDGREARAERLPPEVRPGVDLDVDRPGLGVRHDVRRGTRPVVARVVRGAYAAVAADDGDAGGGARAEQRRRDAEQAGEGSAYASSGSSGASPSAARRSSCAHASSSAARTAGRR